MSSSSIIVIVIVALVVIMLLSMAVKVVPTPSELYDPTPAWSRHA